jgi:glycosyltransferase involved in cell wall biosynthesis
MKIAIIGTRGIPANYGGFETFAENLSTRLVRKGHDVTVYCRPKYTDKNLRSYKGVKLVILPAIRHKYFDTVSHTFLSVMHVIFTKTEVIYFCNSVNSVFTAIPRMFGMKTVINVDGLEWKRKKWNFLAKGVYRVSEYLATIIPHKIITDSMAVHDYYKERFGKESECISYGADAKIPMPPGPVMEKAGLKKRNFILYVSRLEPENNAHILIEAYEKVKGGIMPLVIVGDAPYGTEYIKKLRSTKDKRIRFLGSVFGEGYLELCGNACAYVHGNEVGGTSPALLEAMACGNCVIANGTEINKEVVNGCGLWFKLNDADDLKNKIEYIIDNPSEAEKYRLLAVERINMCYKWDDVVEKTETVMRRLLDRKH